MGVGIIKLPDRADLNAICMDSLKDLKDREANVYLYYSPAKIIGSK
jgi:hypothetical protein